MALARALAVEPQVLLLDEPFGALDARVREELRAWLRRLHDEVHVTTIFVTHDQEEALEISEQVVVINEGRVEQSAPPQEVYDRPANEFVMSFVGPVTKVGDRLVRPHDVQVLEHPGEGTQPAEVVRLARLGFEVRAELQLGEGELAVARSSPARRRTCSSWPRARSSTCASSRSSAPPRRLPPTCGSRPRRTTPCGRRWSSPPPPATARP